MVDGQHKFGDLGPEALSGGSLARRASIGAARLQAGIRRLIGEKSRCHDQTLYSGPYKKLRGRPALEHTGNINIQEANRQEFAEERQAEKSSTATQADEKIVVGPGGKPMTAGEFKRLNDWLELDFLPPL
ncbi:hypothetical protein BTHE68_31470 [Burkholderia sp. THE68]|uniref:hypothetical protein n=1 Tax=Burkholderia sp. THE68 TaxID=758782 RepID=UPI001315C054|nr:hypothetical protein [Burkholderia sp. THE68]BBU29413.1 hypothetical protein BTHE68_31470 [Burkholderia sp. THE68]